MKLRFLIILSILSNSSFSQVPLGIPFQGVYSSDLSYFADRKLAVRQTILKGNSEVYKEEHIDVPSPDGQFSIIIGKGNALSGKFENIIWSNGDYFLRTEVRIIPKENYIDFGTTQLLSVPYAFLARSTHGWNNIGDSSLVSNFKYIGINNLEPRDQIHIGESFTLNSLSKEGILSNNISSYTNKLLHNGYGSRITFDQFGRISFLASNTFKLANELFTPTNYFTFSGNGTFTSNFTSGKIQTDQLSTKTISTTNLIALDTVKTGILEITGGSDIAELFESDEILEPGDVVSICKLNPNKIIKSKFARDPNVIGVISGANKINSGIILSQKDKLTGKYPVAINGRVKVKIFGAVKIGSLLTSSKIPGNAQLARKREPSTNTIGKVIGKKDEQGFVLMLIKQ